MKSFVYTVCVLGVSAAFLFAEAEPAAEPQAQAAASSYVNFSFDQVDIRLLVKLVGDITGKRFVVDDSITGKVTVVTPSRVPTDEVYALFLSILESTGYSVVEKNQICHVMALPEKILSETPVIGPDDAATRREGIITKVIRLEHISAADAKKTLEPMIRGGKAGAIAAFGQTNHLIVTDTAENIARLEKILAELDKPGSARIAEIVKLLHASAEDVAAQLIVAMRGGETAEGKLSRRIQQMADGSLTLPSDVVVVPATQANSLVLVGSSVQISEIKRVIEKLDIESPSGHGRMSAIFLKYLSADEAAKSLNALLAKTVDKDQRQRIAIEPSTANNALIVDASPSDYQVVCDLVAQLDQVPQQVLVEVLIAEMAVNKNLDLSVEWASIDEPAEGRTTVMGRSRPASSDTLSDILTDGAFPQGLAVGIAKGTYTDSSGNVLPSVPLLIKALAENRDVKILSNIPLWAQNNKEASVSVVDNIPVLRSTIEGGSGTSRDVIQNIDRMDVGIKLKLTPHVNPDREVLMVLNPSIEAITDEGSSETEFAPTISKREVSTTVTVPDKATVVISGLIREDRVKNVAKIPILGDIPVLGVLFRSTVDKKQRTNLLIFVTPHIVTDMREADALKKSLEGRTSMTGVTTNLNIETPNRK